MSAARMCGALRRGADARRGCAARRGAERRGGAAHCGRVGAAGRERRRAGLDILREGQGYPPRGGAARGVRPGGPEILAGRFSLFPEACQLEEDERAKDPHDLERKEFASGGLVVSDQGGSEIGEAMECFPRARTESPDEGVQARDREYE